MFSGQLQQPSSTWYEIKKLNVIQSNTAIPSDYAYKLEMMTEDFQCEI